MALLWLLLLILSSQLSVALDRKSVLWESVATLKEGLSSKAVEALESQEALLRVVDAYREYQGELMMVEEDDEPMYPFHDHYYGGSMMQTIKKSIKALLNETEEVARRKKMKMNKKKERGNGVSLVSEVHADVVMVGFPSSAVEMIRNTWFEHLGREDDLLSEFGGQGDTIKVPGGVKTHLHFHIVQVSFHVADVLTDLYDNLLDQGNVNVWEVEEALESLAKVVSDAHAAKHSRQPTATIFVLNLKLPHAYRYRAGFSPDSLQVMRQSKDLVKLGEKVLAGVKRPTRLEHLASANSAANALDSASSLNRARDELEKAAAARADTDTKPSATAAGATSGGAASHVHLRDAVKETRAWAKAFVQPSVSHGHGQQAKEKRAFRLLSSTSTSPALTSARLALAHDLLSPAPQLHHASPQPCSAAHWVGSGRVMWIDLRAQGQHAVDLLGGGSVAVAPAPRALDDKDWLAVGSSGSKRETDVSAILTLRRKALARHQRSAESYYAQSSCPAEILDDALSPRNRDSTSVVSFIARSVYDAVPRVAFLEPACAALAIQVALLSFGLRSSEMLEARLLALGSPASAAAGSGTGAEAGAEAEAEAGAGAGAGEGWEHFIREARELHAQSLSEVLEVSNVLEGSPHAQTAALAPAASSFLGHVSSLLLQASRRSLAPPLSVTFDPFARRLVVPPASAAEEGEPGSAVGKAGAGSGWGLGLTVHARARAHSGRPLLDLVRGLPGGVSADPSVTTRANPAELSLEGEGGGEEEEGEEEEEEVEEQKGGAGWSLEADLWRSSLPPLLFPAKVDVRVYVFRLQSSYEPLASAPAFSNSGQWGAAGAQGLPGGFDLPLLQRQLARLVLPSQTLTVSLEVLDATPSPSNGNGKGKDKGKSKGQGADFSLGLAVASCLRSHVVPIQGVYTAAGEAADPLLSREVSVLDSACLWALLQHYDDDDAKSAAGRERGLAGGSQTQHLPIFLLSLDTPLPTYVDEEFSLAANVGSGVVVVQNSQREVPLGLGCASGNGPTQSASPSAPPDEESSSLSSSSLELLADGRSPTGPALMEAARILVGLNSQSEGHCDSSTAASLTAAAVGFGSKPTTSLGVGVRAGAGRGAGERGLSAHVRAAAERDHFSLGASDGAGGGGSCHARVSLVASLFQGQSPSFSTSATTQPQPLFSQLELEAAHRGRVLRSLGVAKEEQALLPAAAALDSVFVAALAALDKGDWAAAASLANSLHLLLDHLRSNQGNPPSDLLPFFQLLGSSSGSSSSSGSGSSWSEGEGDSFASAGRDEGVNGGLWEWLLDALLFFGAAAITFLYLPAATRSSSLQRGNLGSGIASGWFRGLAGMWADRRRGGRDYGLPVSSPPPSSQGQGLGQGQGGRYAEL